MKFTVTLSEQAEDDLAIWWLDSTDRREINRSELNALRLLAADPYQAGVELVEGLFALDLPPLRYYYEIDFEHAVVEITSIAKFKS